MQKKFKNGRRNFLTSSVLGGFGALSLAKTSQAYASEPSAECYVFSMTDNLSYYLQLVNEVMNDVMAKALTRVSKALDTSISLHTQICGLIKDLEKELPLPDLKDDLKQIKELSEACCGSAEQLKACLAKSGQDVQTLANSLTVMGKQLCAQVQQLWSDGKPELSPKAIQIIKDLICLVNNEQFQKFNLEIAAGHNYTQEANALIKRFTKIRGHVRTARRFVANIENPCNNIGSPCKESDLKDDRTNAETNLHDAVVELRQVISENRDKGVNAPKVIQPQPQTSLKPSPNIIMDIVELGTSTPAQSQPLTLLSPEMLERLPDKLNPNEELDVFMDSNNEKQCVPRADVLILYLTGALKAIPKLCPLPASPEVKAKCQERTPSDKKAEEDENTCVRTNHAVRSAPARIGDYIAIFGLLLNYCPPGTPAQQEICKRILEGARTNWFVTAKNRRRIVRDDLKEAMRIGKLECAGQSNISGLAVELAKLV